MPEITVVVPVYNTEKYLNECLDTILGQTFTDFELICVDDGSTDNSREILNDYEKHDSRVKIISQNKLNGGAARNNGLRHASGEYIIFLDSDDFFDIDMLEILHEKLFKFQADICVCNARIYGEATGRFTSPRHFLDDKKVPKFEPFSYKSNQDYIFNFTSPAPWNMLFKRQFLQQHQLQFQEIERSNDLSFFGKSIIKAESIVTVNKRCVNYRLRKSGNLQSHNDDTPLCFYDALLEVRDEVLKMGIMNEVKTSFMNFALNVFMYNIDKMQEPENFILLHSKLIDEGIKDFYFNDFTGNQHYFPHSKIKFQDCTQIDLEELLCRQYKKNPETSSCQIIKNIGKKSVKVSVIIPVYNTAEFLKAALDSAIGQTLQDIEIICINDGSTDDSWDILQKYATDDKRIILVNKGNEGISLARNCGMDIATGQYIAFLDSDDTMEKNALELLYQKAEKYCLDIVYFNTCVRFVDEYVVEDMRKKIQYYQRVRDYHGVMTGIDLYVMMNRTKEYLSSVCLQFYGREFLNSFSIRFYERIIHEDNLFSFQAFLHAKRVGYIKEALNNRTMRYCSIMTSTENANNFIGYFTCYVEMVLLEAKFESEFCISEEALGHIWANIHAVHNSAIRIYRKLPQKEVSKIAFKTNSMEERFYTSFVKSEQEIRRIKQSAFYVAGKEVTGIQKKLNEKNKLLALFCRRSLHLLKRLT